MKLRTSLAFAAALATTAPIAAPAFAEEAAATEQLKLRAGMIVYSSDGRRVGKVYSVSGDSDAPTAVRVILNQKMVSIPASTLSPGDKKSRLVTSLAYDEIG